LRKHATAAPNRCATAAAIMRAICSEVEHLKL
jgi:hypothetical protein